MQRQWVAVPDCRPSGCIYDGTERRGIIGCISARGIMGYDMRVYKLVELFLSEVPEPRRTDICWPNISRTRSRIGPPSCCCRIAGRMCIPGTVFETKSRLVH